MIVLSPVDVDDAARDQGVVALVLIWKLVSLSPGAALFRLITPCHTSSFRLQ